MKHLSSLFAFAVLAMTSTLSADDRSADSRAFVASASGQFGTVNTTAGQFLLFGFTPKVLSGMAIGSNQTLYGLDADNNLVRIDRETVAATVVGNIGLPVVTNGNVTLFTSLENGKLFALDPSNNLYLINPAIGRATLVGFTGIPVPNFDTCNCVTANSLAGAYGYIYFTFEVDDLATLKPTTPSTLYRIDSYTGVATRVGATHADAPIVGAGFIDGQLYGFTFGMPVNQPNKILHIDMETGAATFDTNQAPNLDPIFSAVGMSRQPDLKTCGGRTCGGGFAK